VQNKLFTRTRDGNTCPMLVCALAFTCLAYLQRQTSLRTVRAYSVDHPIFKMYHISPVCLLSMNSAGGRKIALTLEFSIFAFFPTAILQTEPPYSARPGFCFWINAPSQSVFRQFRRSISTTFTARMEHNLHKAIRFGGFSTWSKCKSPKADSHCRPNKCAKNKKKGIV
jgi:hypothetical protein